MKTSDVLNKAADLIEERGWSTGVGGWNADLGASLCMEGGILAALGYNGWRNDIAWQRQFWSCPAYRAVSDHLGLDSSLVKGSPTDDLWEWNDEPGRTVEQVIATLRAAAVIEAARETTADREPVA